MFEDRITAHTERKELVGTWEEMEAAKTLLEAEGWLITFQGLYTNAFGWPDCSSDGRWRIVAERVVAAP